MTKNKSGMTIDNCSDKVHMHNNGQRTGYVGGGKLRVLQLAVGGAGGDAVL